MSDQLALTLDDPMSGRARKSDPISSVVAARTVNAQAQRARIRRVLRESPYPLWSARIAAATGIPTAQVNSRLCAMETRDEVIRLEEMGLNERGQPVYLWADALAPSIVNVETGGRL